MASSANGRPEGLAAPAVRRWLLLVWALILAMVMVGGITRLTGSGLSMVQWRPLMGAIPPLDDAQWQDVFRRYRETPQYERVNHWMELADFKRIFFWEYVHRLLGRLIGVAFLIPWLYFIARRRLRGRALARTSLALILGGLQGLLGWYMVRSGLVDVPRVSHFRLAAHLALAFGVGQWIWWLWLEGRELSTPKAGERVPTTWIGVFIAVLALQVVYGAFMAGTRAGYDYATFPDMHGIYGPQSFFGDSWIEDALYDPSAIHYLHRALGWVALVLGLGLWAYLARVVQSRAVIRAARWVALLTFLQFNLGALTVVSRVDIPWAIAHQGLAFVLLTSATTLLHRARWARRPSNAGYP